MKALSAILFSITYPMDAMRRFHCLSALLVCLLASPSTWAQDSIQAGSTRLLLAPRNADRPAPPVRAVEPTLQGKAVPTNQWYSSLLFSQDPQPLYAQPLTGQASLDGFEVSLPLKTVVSTERRDTEIHYPHRAAIRISPAGFQLTPARLKGISDWSADIAMGTPEQRFDVTMAHGPICVGAHGRGGPAAASRGTGRSTKPPGRPVAGLAVTRSNLCGTGTPRVALAKRHRRPLACDPSQGHRLFCGGCIAR